MPVAGRKPKDGPVRHHTPAAHDWVEVVAVPFTGRALVSLPAKRRITDRYGEVRVAAWEPMTRTWWKTVSSMPHCRLWTKADWQFAVATAVIADKTFRGDSSAAAELRQREKIMGTTLDARRDLRIRYVPKIAEPKMAIVPASAVVSIDERRRRSTGVDDAT
jgi:hypothetical protein